MIDRFMRVLDWVAFIFLIFVSAIVFDTIYDGRDFIKLFESIPVFIIPYIFIKIIIYIVQGTWRWLPWCK